jgi:hypothetical protein
MTLMIARWQRQWRGAALVAFFGGLMALLSGCAPATQMVDGVLAGVTLDQSRPTFVYFFTPT